MHSSLGGTTTRRGISDPKCTAISCHWDKARFILRSDGGEDGGPLRCRPQVILHSTFARILKLPAGPDPAATIAQLTRMADALSQHLCGLRVSLPELWFIEEEDLLALALGGKFRKRAVPLQCSAPA